MSTLTNTPATPTAVENEITEPAPAPTPAPSTAPSTPAPSTPATSPTSVESWPRFIRSSTEVAEITGRLGSEVAELVAASGLDYCCLSLFLPHDSIGSYESNRVYEALQMLNGNKAKNVLMMVVSDGGRIEPAYQIAKICKAFSKSQFIVTVPRIAKSAATLLALGADAIHVGMLGELGPIDPQVGGLPALGVKRALETIADICEDHPGASEAFATYMAKTLTIEQIGYCERVPESAQQYAERLLVNKSALKAKAPAIARTLVYEYKDHSFVIDAGEATSLLGSYIVTDSPELKLTEKIFQLFFRVNVLLGPKRRLYVAGDVTRALIFGRND